MDYEVIFYSGLESFILSTLKYTIPATMDIISV